MAANNSTPVTSTGPALGNVPTPDSYLRIKQNIDGLQTQLANLQSLTQSASSLLTPAQLQQIQKALQANGPNPLNLTALPGQLLQPQQGLIPSVRVLPGTGTDGQVVFYRHVIWRYAAATHQWTPISTIIIQDYEYNLSKYPPAQYAPGVIFLSLGTNVTFVEQDLPSGSTWTPLYSETVAYPHSDRSKNGTVTTSVNNNNGLITYRVAGANFTPEMAGQQIWINGVLYPISAYNNASLLLLGANAGNQNNANYVFEFPSVNYPNGALFYETDRTVFYFCNNATGHVSWNNNVVTWSSGNRFDPYWAGRNIQIGNNNFQVLSVAQNQQSMNVNATPGNANTGTDVYLMPRGAWVYASGIYASVNANIPEDLDPATDLGFYFFPTDIAVMQKAVLSIGNLYFAYQWGVQTANSSSAPHNLTALDAGYLFYASDLDHQYQWNGNNWNFAPGDPGAGWIVAGSPQGGLWALCNGGNASIATSNISTTSVTTPNMTGNVFILGGSPGNQQNATHPTWAANAHTDNEANHTHVIPDQSTGNEANHTHAFNFTASSTTLNYTTGISSQIVVTGAENSGTTGPGSPHLHDVPSQSTNNGSPHNHNLSNNNAVLNPPSEANGGLPIRINLSWYMRL
jgi:hypothetical protein